MATVLDSETLDEAAELEETSLVLDAAIIAVVVMGAEVVATGTTVVVTGTTVVVMVTEEVVATTEEVVGVMETSVVLIEGGDTSTPLSIHT